jgi:hypothetical protein
MMMKRYKLNNDYQVLTAFPYLFQLTTSRGSYRLRLSNPDPEANFPIPITIETETFTENHVLMYTPKTYMRFSWIDDENTGGNGHMEMGICDFSNDYDQFIQWQTLINDLPKEVIQFVINTLRNPEAVKTKEVPLIDPSDSNTNENNVAPPPPPKPIKHRKFKIAKKKVVNKTQRRRRNV